MTTSYAIFDKMLKKMSLMTGNVISDLQSSSYIRPFNETMGPDGKLRLEGVLWEFDLKQFAYLNSRQRAAIKRYTQDEQTQLYYFRICLPHKTIHLGYGLYSANGDVLWLECAANTAKRRMAFDVCITTISSLITDAFERSGKKVAAIAEKSPAVDPRALETFVFAKGPAMSVFLPLEMRV